MFLCYFFCLLGIMKKLGIFESSIDYFKQFNRDSSSRINSIKANRSFLSDLNGLYTFVKFVTSNRKKKPINLNFLSTDGAFNDICKVSDQFDPEVYNVFVLTDRNNESVGTYNYTSYSSLYLLVYLVFPVFFFKAIFSCLGSWSFVKDAGIVKSTTRFTIFLSKRFVFSCLVRLCKAKAIHLVDSYSTNQALNFSAKEMKIPVVEIQHGIISKGHIGYNRLYLNDSFYPNKLLLLSKKFVSHVPVLQLDHVQHEITRMNYFNKLSVYDNKEERLTIIIGQPSISSLLLDLYKTLAFKGVRVLYKPHPRELVKLDQGIEIFHEDKFNVNNLYIGGFSTLLLELAESGCSEITALKDFIPDYYDQVLLDFGISLNTVNELKISVLNSGLHNEL
jgi:hypothetical protein